MTQKKTLQLGMNPSTASGRLVKDILWDLIVKTNQNLCCKCGREMSRSTFSIEHIKPWLDSENPVGLYFDLNNISFSHQKCNYESKRLPHKRYFTEEEKRKAKNEKQKNKWQSLTKEEQKAIRRQKYLRYGK